MLTATANESAGESSEIKGQSATIEQESDVDMIEQEKGPKET